MNCNDMIHDPLLCNLDPTRRCSIRISWKCCLRAALPRWRHDCAPEAPQRCRNNNEVAVQIFKAILAERYTLH